MKWQRKDKYCSISDCGYIASRVFLGGEQWFTVFAPKERRFFAKVRTPEEAARAAEVHYAAKTRKR